jgi:phytoene desaturase
MPKAIVIGAGFGGIAAALRLRHKGYDVTVIDKQDKLGGRAYQYERKTHLGTFIHDAGPTVITAKFLFDELFELFGKKREDYVEFRDLYPWYRIQFADGSTFDYGGTIEQMEAQIRKFGGERDVEGFRKYLKHSKKIFDVGFTELGAVPFHKFGTMLKCAPDLLRLKNYKTVWGMAKKYIKNDNLRRVFSFQPLLVGGNPFNTTSIYSLIFYLEREWGVQFAMGGTGAIVRGLERLMREEGVEVRLGDEVSNIELETDYNVTHNGVPYAKGVRLVSGEIVPKDHSSHTVVCNADAPMVYSKLLDKKYRKGIAARRIDSKLAPQKYSMGLFVMYFGTKTTYPNVAHHTIVLGRQYKELIDDLFDRFGLETDDTSVYLHRPTCTDPSMAPPGCESFYVLVPVPNNQPLRSKQRRKGATATEPALRADGSIDWDVMGPIMRDATVKYLERTILPNLSQTIVDDFYVTPDHFQKNLNSLHGAGFSIQPIFSQSAWFRFHNKAPGIEGLYFVGAGTHPGAGMPGVLCSAKVLDHLIPPVPQPATAAIADR